MLGNYSFPARSTRFRASGIERRRILRIRKRRDRRRATGLGSRLRFGRRRSGRWIDTKQRRQAASRSRHLAITPTPHLDPIEWRRGLGERDRLVVVKQCDLQPAEGIELLDSARNARRGDRQTIGNESVELDVSLAVWRAVERAVTDVTHSRRAVHLDGEQRRLRRR